MGRSRVQRSTKDALRQKKKTVGNQLRLCSPLFLFKRDSIEERVEQKSRRRAPDGTTMIGR